MVFPDVQLRRPGGTGGELRWCGRDSCDMRPGFLPSRIPGCRRRWDARACRPACARNLAERVMGGGSRRVGSFPLLVAAALAAARESTRQRAPLLPVAAEATGRSPKPLGQQ